MVENQLSGLEAPDPATRVDIPGYTPAQQVMRQDIEGREPVTAKHALDGLFGKQVTLSDDELLNRQIREIALEIISTIPQPLRLGMRDWQQVQNAIETGIYTGWNRGRASRH